MLPYVQGIFVILFTVLFCLLCLLLFPLRTQVMFRASPMGGAGTLALGFLLLRFRLYFRLHLLEDPPFTIELLRKNGETKLLSYKKKRAPNLLDLPAIKRIVRIQKIDAAWRIGLPASPAATALLAGAAECLMNEAARALLPGTKAGRVFLRAYPLFGQEACFFSFCGIASALPAQIIWEILLRKRNQHASD